jgi:AmmeMemoRadiSam system protein A
VSFPYTLALDEQQELLRIARATLREHARSGRYPPGKPHRDTMLVPAAVFVTLHRAGQLRGCIGTTTAERPIYRAVQEMAVAAATREPRFPPVGADELIELEIEISVLGPVVAVDGPGSIEIGRDGLVIEGRGRRGLLLPQVAIEAGWNVEQFLDRTCQKAGLPSDAWRDGDVTISTFPTQVFNESDLSAIRQ